MAEIMRALSLCFLATTIHSVNAANKPRSCSNDLFSAMNATGSTRFPGLLPNGTANETWTLNTGVEVLPGTSLFDQYFWLDTDPTIDIPPLQLPVNGCAKAIQVQTHGPLLVDNITTTNSSQYNSCAGVFEQDCYNAILDTLNSEMTALMASGTSPTCTGLLSSWPAQCMNTTTRSFSWWSRKSKPVSCDIHSQLYVSAYNSHRAIWQSEPWLAGVRLQWKQRQPIRWLGDGAHPGRDERLLGAFRESA